MDKATQQKLEEAAMAAVVKEVTEVVVPLLRKRIGYHIKRLDAKLAARDKRRQSQKKKQEKKK